MFILLVDCMDYNIKDPNFQLLGHQQSGLKAGEPAKQLPSQKQPKNLFFFVGFLDRATMEDVASFLFTRDMLSYYGFVGPQWKNVAMLYICLT